MRTKYNNNIQTTKEFCINTELSTYRLNKQTTRIIITIIRIITTTGTTITTAAGKPSDLDIPVINTKKIYKK
jgi:hypothetical protein